MRHFYLLTVTFFLISSQLIGQTKTGYLTHDGTWCWFSDPRAIIVENTVISGWVKSNGTIEAVSFDTASESLKTYELYHRLEKDDHDNPAFSLTKSGEIIAMYTRHSKKDLFINRLSNYQINSSYTGAQLIHPMSQEELANFPKEHVTYANPYYLKNDNRIYCFGRWTGYKPNMMWSEDEGTTWTKSKVFITNYPFDKNNRPYVKYFSDGLSKIHMVFTDGHPRNEVTNSIYYAYYENGAFYKASGHKICTMDDLPFEPKDASIVYTSNEKDGRAWIADISHDKTGNPVILFTKSPTVYNHQYWYGRFKQNRWVQKKICDSGKSFPKTPVGKTEKEPHYFGGMTLHPNNSDIIYLSRQINGVFEIERWKTENKGESWETEAITKNSKYDNVRPYIPRGLLNESSEIVLWMENQKYIHYTDYKTSIKYSIREK